MASQKTVGSLLDKTTALVYKQIYDYCSYLEENQVPDKSTKLAKCHEIIQNILPIR